MPRKRSPKRDLAYQLWLGSGKKRKLKDIAEEVGVSESQVRKWKNQDDWNGNVTNKKSNGNGTKNEKRARAEEDIGEDIRSVMKNPNLTDKQRLFCVIYVRCFNATKAYQKAYGCSYDVAHAEGYKLLAKPCIKDEIQRLKQNRLNREMLSADDIFQRYMDIAFADITDFVNFGRREVEVMGAFGPVQVVDEDTGAKVTLTKIVNAVEFKEDYEVDGTLIAEVKQGRDGASIKLPDRIKALEWLTAHMDMATEEQKAKIDKLKAETSRIKGEDPDEDLQDDGFIEALRGEVTNIWDEE